MLRTRLTEGLGLAHPIIQAGMAGGVTTPELVAAVSNAGGLGTLGAGYMRPEEICAAVERIRALTKRPFAVNLFIPDPIAPAVSPAEMAAMNRALDVFRAELGIPPSPNIGAPAEPFAAQLEAVLQLRVPVFSFTFGVPDAGVMKRLKQAGMYVIGTATSVAEAIALEQAGVDAVVAQGSEAGGHRGTFAHPFEQALIGTMALVPQVVDAVRVPVIAAGGIMDGRGLAASLLLGADGVQMGTAFLTCPESGAHPAYQQAVLAADETQTSVTRVYSGKPARGIVTQFMRRMAAYDGPIPAYPVQNALTRDIRQAAARQGNPEYMSLWAGQGLRLACVRSAAQVVEETVKGAAALLHRGRAQAEAGVDTHPRDGGTRQDT